MIGIIDYGMGNLRSVEKALQKVGAQTRFVRGVGDLADLSGILLPGVGAFGDAVRNLHATGTWEPLRQWAADNRPFLGICLGYQLLFDSSEEAAPDVRGLGIFPGKVVRFMPEEAGVKVPQIGWNNVRVAQPESALFRETADGSYFYFVHSYYPVPADASVTALATEYAGVEFASAVGRGNVFGTQFHPEKSQAAGLTLLRRFAQICGEGLALPDVVPTQGETMLA
ncbi:imidazole glycerol phosphate synthase subunit HisH [Verrucomicrobia bacterium LW23]|nr:imidazole glycerol phosphate synthase subunit HisH [Verrucomicrobia bacterium LW23]